MPAIVGVDAYGRTPLTIFLQKLGWLALPPETRDLRWGRLMEAACLQAYREDTGAETREVDTTVHPQYPWLAATPDALVVGDARGVEIKTVGFTQVHEWAGGVPDHVIVQVAVNMAVFDHPLWDVGRFFWSSRDWAILRVERDRVLEELLITAGQRFYDDHIVPHIPPPRLMGVPEAHAYLQQRYASHTDDLLDVPQVPWIELAVGDYFDARRSHRWRRRRCRRVVP